MRLVASTPIVPICAHTDPSANASATRPSKMTDSTAAAVGSIVITTPASRTASCADAATATPASASGPVADVSLPHTRVVRPAAARLRAIADPMIPAPSTATVAFPSAPFALAITASSPLRPSCCRPPAASRDKASAPAWRPGPRGALPLAGIRQVQVAGNAAAMVPGTPGCHPGLSPRVAEGQGDPHDGARPRLAPQRDPAAQRLHSVLQPEQAGPAADIGAAASVVTDVDPQHAVAHADLHLRRGGLRVLGHVGQRLGDRVVSGEFDRLGQPPRPLNVEAHGNGGAAGQRPERRAQPALGEDRRVDAASDLAQLLKHAVRLADRPVQSLGQLAAFWY